MKGKRDEHGKTCVIKRLTGHEGVIFSISFNKQGTLLCSVSDDRSIRLWNVTNLQTFDSNGQVEPLTVVYGHTARVWDAKLLESCFVSIGEDLMCNVWDYEGNIIKVHKGHTGMTLTITQWFHSPIFLLDHPDCTHLTSQVSQFKCMIIEKIQI